MHVTPHCSIKSTFFNCYFHVTWILVNLDLFYYFFLLLVGFKMCFKDVLAFIYKFQIVLFFYILVNLNCAFIFASCLEDQDLGGGVFKQAKPSS